MNAATLKRLAALHLPPEAMQEILSIIASCIEPLETRRQRDRERKKAGKSAENLRNVRGNSQEIPTENPPQHILPPLREKPKKVSLCAVPEQPSDKNLEDATSRGWPLDYAKSEWQRFRDWSLNKGRRHRNVDAAWRNWVTSPYQKPVENGNVQASQRHPGGEFGASKDRFREAYAELKAFNAEQRSRGDGEVVEILRPVGRTGT
jgi:hypothetical protein